MEEGKLSGLGQQQSGGGSPDIDGGGGEANLTAGGEDTIKWCARKER